MKRSNEPASVSDPGPIDIGATVGGTLGRRSGMMTTKESTEILVCGVLWGRFYRRVLVVAFL